MGGGDISGIVIVLLLEKAQILFGFLEGNYSPHTLWASPANAIWIAISG